MFHCSISFLCLRCLWSFGRHQFVHILLHSDASHAVQPLRDAATYIDVLYPVYLCTVDGRCRFEPITDNVCLSSNKTFLTGRVFLVLKVYLGIRVVSLTWIVRLLLHFHETISLSCKRQIRLGNLKVLDDLVWGQIVHL